MSTPYDLNGTVIDSQHSIAVYSGIEYASKYTVYDQLLPVKHYGQEYVVAVDDTKLELQIISELRHVQITFSTGATVSTGERRLYNRSLERGESLHFTATRPVLVTLSRADGYRSAFTTVPPVQSYVTHRGVWLFSEDLNITLKVLTDRRATLLIKNKEVNDLLTWRGIEGSRYKVGTLVQSKSRFLYSTSISSDVPFTVLSFYNGSVYNSGYNLSVEEPEHYTGQSYLMALAGYHRYPPSILASAGETGGQWQVQDPRSGRVWSRRFNPYNTDYFFPNRTTSRVVVVHVRDDTIQIRGRVDYVTSFSPLPASALGTKYIMSSCLPTTDTTSYKSVLMIATHSKKADIDVIFRLDGNVTYGSRTYIEGDTLSVRLDRYQTISLNSSSDMTRAIVNATETIAVYSGTYDVDGGIFTTFEQLLPVKHYGDEYILSIQDHYYHERTYDTNLLYQLQVVTDHSDTSLMLNNGSSVSMGEDGVYRKQCEQYETFYFTTTRPTMATLCIIGRQFYSDGFIVVPPVSLYSKETIQQTRGTFQILTDQENSNVDVQQTHETLSTVFSPPLEWKNVSRTRFKVGTLSFVQYSPTTTTTTTIRSNSTFVVFGYDMYYIYNGGYSFRKYLYTETSTPDGNGNKLNTSGLCEETSTPNGIGITLNASRSFQAGGSNNAALIVGVVCGIVLVSLLVAFIAYVFYIRRTTVPVKKTTEQAAEAPPTPMNIYVLPDRVEELLTAGEDTYTELMFNSKPSDINTDDSTPTYVNISEVNTNARINQQC